MFLLKGSDDQQALELASRLHGDEKVRAAYTRYLEARAGALVKCYLARDTRSVPSWPLLVAMFIDR